LTSQAPNIAVKVESDGFGAFVGQRGFYVKYLDAVLNKLLGVGVKAIEVETGGKHRKKRK